jgi:hypothetical protein
LASKMLRCGSFSNKSRKIMPNELSGDAELTAQCTATRMFAIYQATAIFWALAEKKLIDPQHVFATNEALALGFEQMAANISADDTQGRINQLTAEMLREFEGVIKNVVDNAVEDRAGVSVESIRSDRVTAPERGTQSRPWAVSARLSRAQAVAVPGPWSVTAQPGNAGNPGFSLVGRSIEHDSRIVRVCPRR